MRSEGKERFSKAREGWFDEFSLQGLRFIDYVIFYARWKLSRMKGMELTVLIRESYN